MGGGGGGGRLIFLWFPGGGSLFLHFVRRGIIQNLGNGSKF